MAMNDRYLLIHGHFYQPPRENPWTGEIDPQFSAAPWENWNKRIADECYIPMARSRIYNSHGRITDLYNNYAHTDFNFGPTLLSWLASHHPELIRHLRDAMVMDRTYGMAQAFNHMIMPLADARDKHTQILWGLKEFGHRFGFFPDGMWLPECGIDFDTTRALIDHGIKYIILSPHQASSARPFGQHEWRDVSMGGIDTRRAYRLFDIDGGGRTHFDRHIDVLFYTPGLNLKVSFDHILNRPDDLARELEQCYRPDYPGAQLVSIVTDGEIYGHHEKNGETALSRLYADIAPALGLTVCSAAEFVRDNPPLWEVKLWNGEDNRGSSWSCQHGTGRWFRDCGCTPPAPAGWNQRWRGPLRSAFDMVRDRIKQAARRELGKLLWDVDEARDDYIQVILDRSLAARQKFIQRHVQRPLDLTEIETLWRLMEALNNAMLMYTSCGFYFDELSGLEPVQNMRYALRAAELAQPYCPDEDLPALLEQELAHAQSNIPHYKDGAQVFRELVLPSRHANKELAAALAICLAGDFPLDAVSWTVARKIEAVQYADSQGNQVCWGSFVAHDDRLDRFIKATWLARLDDFDNSGIVFKEYEEEQGDPYRDESACPLCPDDDFTWLLKVKNVVETLNHKELMERSEEHGIAYHRLPEAVRGMLYRHFSGEREQDLLAEAAQLGTRAVPFLARARRHGARVPDSIVKTVASAFEQEITQAVLNAISQGEYDEHALEPIERSLRSAHELGLHPSLDIPAQSIYMTAAELIFWVSKMPDKAWLESLPVRRLPDNSEWVPAQAPINQGMSYPSATALSLALGKGLARTRAMLLAHDQLETALLDRLTLPEALAFSRRIGLQPDNWAGVGIQYWDSLETALPRLIASDPAGLLAGEAGDRIRRIGIELGFAPDTVEKRLVAAAKAALQYR